MSTDSNEFLKDRSHSGIGARKAQHLDLCVRPEQYDVESGTTGFGGLTFIHDALPEISADDVDTSVDFLGHRIRFPAFISSMTGGSAEGYRVNKDLARAAQEAGIPVGMGSIRILFRKPEVLDHFSLKKLAPDVPVLANLGAVQLRDMSHAGIIEMLKRLEVQALAVHLNPGQELFQPEGDRDFRGILEGIRSFCEISPLPVIVKETGFGIRPRAARQLLEAGARYVNVAGAGGTNWVQVEAYRLAPAAAAAARAFEGWGLPTAVLLAALPGYGDRVLASGGLRGGMDLAKSVALGAHAGGLALPLIRAVVNGGTEAVLERLGEVQKVLETVMVLTGCRSVDELRRAPLLRSHEFEHAVASLTRAETEVGNAKTEENAETP